MAGITCPDVDNSGDIPVMTKEVNAAPPPRAAHGQQDDGLGPTTDIGARLRALYGSVQDEGVPDQLLDLLERLDNAEQAQRANGGDR